ncbi:hypothetical protein GUITHDRAFT_160714 [Guillardia theta CCMP2712]|uniref:Cytochrome c oxidase subunit Vb n=1 Tax=Guillardia theta (strain CCMP2712) TaxID=905079 RepID=L1K1Z2_GUITC|nr:hypothetical protein GUITHDRAFT_160714 [Guillardia theta CCMP2712]EKX54599.1 hypothetical protein GUITHDRAFT_160714 [Guillardia theta CCMP2712]|eukprot:XP_005841579.1 hypothetical protein GUITHDRAFT_160714 [Guillardia theta CCMP2712]
MAARALSRTLTLTARSILRPSVSAGASAVRTFSGRAPLPEPTWKQQDNLDNVVPTNLDQATGLERAEMLAEMNGEKIFDEHMITPFGTKENPVVIESIFDERIVGCPGDCASGDTRNNNEIRWFLVTSKEPFVCPTCNQVYTLKKIEPRVYNF